MNCAGVNKFAGEVKEKIHHVAVSKEKVAPFPKEKVVPSEKFTRSERVKKGTKLWNDMEEPVHTIHRKDLDNFQGQSKASTGWFDLDHEWSKRKFSTLKPGFY